jgi:hypothetical protein
MLFFLCCELYMNISMFLHKYNMQVFVRDMLYFCQTSTLCSHILFLILRYRKKVGEFSEVFFTMVLPKCLS